MAEMRATKLKRNAVLEIVIVMREGKSKQSNKQRERHAKGSKNNNSIMRWQLFFGNVYFQHLEFQCSLMIFSCSPWRKPTCVYGFTRDKFHLVLIELSISICVTCSKRWSFSHGPFLFDWTVNELFILRSRNRWFHLAKTIIIVIAIRASHTNIT